jgi:hypothetical protein
MVYNPTKPVILETNISGYMIRTILSQRDSQGQKHLVVFYLRKMTLAKLNYDVYNKELLMIVVVLLEWRVYLEEVQEKTEIIMDHKNLMYFTILQRINRRQAW